MIRCIRCKYRARSIKNRLTKSDGRIVCHEVYSDKCNARLKRRLIKINDEA